MVRKHTKPWGEIKREPYPGYEDRVREHKREMERLLEKEDQQAIRGDIEPEVKR